MLQLLASNAYIYIHIFDSSIYTASWMVAYLCWICIIHTYNILLTSSTNISQTKNEAYYSSMDWNNNSNG